METKQPDWLEKIYKVARIVALPASAAMWAASDPTAAKSLSAFLIDVFPFAAMLGCAAAFHFRRENMSLALIVSAFTVAALSYSLQDGPPRRSETVALIWSAILVACVWTLWILIRVVRAIPDALFEKTPDGAQPKIEQRHDGKGGTDPALAEAGSNHKHAAHQECEIGAAHIST